MPRAPTTITDHCVYCGPQASHPLSLLQSPQSHPTPPVTGEEHREVK